MIRSAMKYLNAWGPSIFVMAIIFLLSSRQSIAVSDQHIWNFIVFKSLHIGEYGLLTLLNLRALILTSSDNSQKNFVFYVILAGTLALIYGITDEFHQTFVPTRTGKPVDVLIDSIGITLAGFAATRMKTHIIKYIKKG